MTTWASPEAKASHEKYIKTHNKWLKENYPEKYSSLLKKASKKLSGGPKRKFVGKLGSLYMAYEGLKEVFNTGDIPTSLEERESHRANTIHQFVLDSTAKVIYKDGLAVGVEAPKGSDVDMSKYMPYQAMRSEPVTEPGIPTDGEQMEWIDPMDEWWTKEETVYDKDREMTKFGYTKKPEKSLPVAIFNKAKGVYEGIKYVTPPEIRREISGLTSLAGKTAKTVYKYGMQTHRVLLDPVEELLRMQQEK